MKTIIKNSKKKLGKLEQDNANMHNEIIQLKARSMRYNLLFFNIPKRSKENTTDTFHNLIETKLGIKEAKNKVRIYRSHRIWRKGEEKLKQQLIVAKLLPGQGVCGLNARKLKGTCIGTSEQFPEETESIWKLLCSELKKVKAEGKRAKILSDELIIEDQVNYNGS